MCAWTSASIPKTCHVHIWFSQFPSRWFREWGLDWGIRNAAAIFITESESVFKPEQIVCHLFKGKRCFLNRPERTWAKELWNCQHLSVLEGWQCKKKKIPHMFTGGRCKKFNYFMSTLQVQNLRSQWEGARIWQQDQELGIRSSRFWYVSVIYHLCSLRQGPQSEFLSSLKSGEGRLVLYSLQTVAGSKWVYRKVLGNVKDVKYKKI